MRDFIKREWLFIASAAAFLLSSLVLRRFPSFSMTDFKVIYILTLFFIIINGMKKYNVLDFIAYIISGDGRYVLLRFSFMSFFLSAFVTNDVAVMTLVPIALSSGVSTAYDACILAVFCALCANVGSSLTPLGNPQNIFIYIYYNLHPWEFIKVILPFALFFMFLLLFFSMFHKININLKERPELSIRSYIYILFFIIFVLATIKILPIYVGIVPIVYILISRDWSLLNIDFLLIFTFLMFFGFTDNLMQVINVQVDSPFKVFAIAALLSQLISNVPSALLVADFTGRWDALLWGVNAGGTGFILGSIASIIAYKLYVNKYKRVGLFLRVYHKYSFLIFILSFVLFFIIFS